MTKLFTITLLICSLLATALPVTAVTAPATFADVATEHPFASAIDSARTSGLARGYTDGLFRPENNVNRAEFVKMVVAAVQPAAAITGGNCFPDVKTEWFAPSVCTAERLGYLGGRPDGLFHPADAVNLAEASKVLANAFQIPKSAAQQDGWFQPFAAAVAGRAAVPVGVESLDALLTRAQLVEMLARLQTKVTTTTAVTYETLAAGSGLRAALPQLGSCEELATRVQLSQTFPNYYGDVMPMLMDTAAAPESAATGAVAETKTTAASESAADYSTTNLQVEGVDEADTVKSDGQFFYLIRGESVRIVRAAPAAEMAEVVKITDFGFASTDRFTPSELFIAGDRLVVLGSLGRDFGTPASDSAAKMMPIFWQPSRTAVVIFDVTDRAAPQKVRALETEGDYKTSRLIGSELYFISNKYPNYGLWQNGTAADAAGLLPAARDSRVAATDAPAATCAQVAYFPSPHPVAPQFLTITGLDLTADAPATHAVFLGSAENVYASAANLYVATTVPEPATAVSQFDFYAPPAERTHIYRFTLANATATFTAAGSVPGTVLNQFSLDESAGYFRLATTEHGWQLPNGRATNQLFVLDSNLKKVGELTNLAPGETIYSARFLGQRAYLVTFKTVDPLFVIDLATPTAPRVLGQLKIPGFSEYLHPYDATHLLGIGHDVDESIDADKVHSTDAVYYTAVGGLKLSLFDVADVANPRELWKTVLGDHGTVSEVTTNHKALLFSKTKNLLAFPITIYSKRTADATPGETYPTFQGLAVYALDLVHGFTLRDKISHYAADSSAFAQSGSYFYGGKESISRGLFIGETLYALSNAALSAHDFTSLAELRRVVFGD